MGPLAQIWNEMVKSVAKKDNQWNQWLEHELTLCKINFKRQCEKD